MGRFVYLPSRGSWILASRRNCVGEMTGCDWIHSLHSTHWIDAGLGLGAGPENAVARARS